MAVFLVTYDLNKEAKRPDIVGDIKKHFAAWAKLSESSYAVQTDLSAQGVFNLLSNNIDQNDNLYVISLRQPHYGQGPKDVNDWLSQRLTW
jgi:hypothetical protein